MKNGWPITGTSNSQTVYYLRSFRRTDGDTNGPMVPTGLPRLPSFHGTSIYFTVMIKYCLTVMIILNGMWITSMNYILRDYVHGDSVTGCRLDQRRMCS